MSRTKGVAAVVVAVLSAACSSSPPPGSDPPDAKAPGDPADARVVDPPPDAPPVAVANPGAPGPWVVGVRTVQVVDAARARTFSVEVWYPVDPASPDGD